MQPMMPATQRGEVPVLVPATILLVDDVMRDRPRGRPPRGTAMGNEQTAVQSRTKLVTPPGAS